MKTNLHEKLRVASILAINAGFIDAFCFFNYDERFAGAQTANLIQAGIDLALGDFNRVWGFAIPIFFFIVGVIFRVVFSHFLHKKKRYDALYLLLIQLVGMLVYSILYPTVLNIPASFSVGILSFLMAIQYDTFKNTHGQAYGSIFMTGNIRSLSLNIGNYFVSRDKKYLEHVKTFSMLIASFFIGAILATFLTHILHAWTLILSSLFLIYVYFVLRVEA